MPFASTFLGSVAVDLKTRRLTGWLQGLNGIKIKAAIAADFEAVLDRTSELQYPTPEQKISPGDFVSIVAIRIGISKVTMPEGFLLGFEAWSTGHAETSFE